MPRRGRCARGERNTGGGPALTAAAGGSPFGWPPLDAAAFAGPTFIPTNAHARPRTDAPRHHQGPTGSVVLSERGDTSPAPRHPSFHLFGSMNPSGDGAGKRDLPPGVRQRFGELFVGECTDRNDLEQVVGLALAGVPGAPVAQLVDFYLAARGLAEKVLLDGAGLKPQYRRGCGGVGVGWELCVAPRNLR